MIKLKMKLSTILKLKQKQNDSIHRKKKKLLNKLNYLIKNTKI